MARSPAESFVAYLEEKQRRKRQEEAQAPAKGAGTVLSILNVLAAAPGQRLSVLELQTGSGMSITEFGPGLAKLSQLGYIELNGAPGSETAALTKLGGEVAGLMG